MPAATPDFVLLLNGSLFSPEDRRMASVGDFSTIGLPEFKLGETYTAQVFLYKDSIGTIDPASGDAAYAPRLGIGTPGSPDLVEVPPGAFTPIANPAGWSFDLPFTSALLVAAFAAAPTAIQTLTLEFQMLAPDGKTRKWYSRTVRILPAVMVDGAPPTPPVSAAAVLNLAAITGLYGAQLTDLNALSLGLLQSLGLGGIVQLHFAGRLMMQYRLRALIGGEVNTPVTGRLVVCANDATKVFELDAINANGAPCVWDEVAQRWCELSGYGGAVATQPGLALPA